MMAYTIHTDKQLLQLLRDGDPAAFTEIYERYWEMLYAIAYNRTRDMQAAQDIVQEIFTSLWQNRDKAAINHLGNYLASAVKYMTLAYLRKSGQTILAHQVPDVPPFDGYPGTEAPLQYKHLLRLLLEETNNLPEKCRLIFTYSRVDGLSTREIARQLDISPRTVETQLSKALRHLRKRFKYPMAVFFSSFL